LLSGSHNCLLGTGAGIDAFLSRKIAQARSSVQWETIIVTDRRDKAMRCRKPPAHQQSAHQRAEVAATAPSCELRRKHGIVMTATIKPDDVS
jgi:hypothetical protein